MKFQSQEWWRSLGRYALITLVPSLIVAVYVRLIRVNQATVALTFIILILLVATRWRLTYSIYLSVLCTLLYNFFFLPPIGTLMIRDPQNWLTLAAFLLASALMSHFADSERQATVQSESRRDEVQSLFEFSEHLLLQDDLRALTRNAPSLIASTFRIRAVALYIREQGTAYYSDPEDELLPMYRLRAVAEDTETAEQISPGIRVMPLAFGMRSSGALALTAGRYGEGMYEAIANLMAIALERAAALERFSHMEASREGERLRSALLDSVTHELRTPLTGIRVAATMLIGQPDITNEDRREMYTILDEESARLDRMIGRAVEMALLDSDSLQVRPRPQRLSEVLELAIEDAASLLRNRRVEVSIPDDQAPVPMDRELVRRVLLQLIENAAKYSPQDRPITISSTLDQQCLHVTVGDQGPGIPEAELPFIFDKFFRGKQGERVQGSGMGLAIVKAILRAHGGGITVESSDRGSAFTFRLRAGTSLQGVEKDGSR